MNTNSLDISHARVGVTVTEQNPEKGIHIDRLCAGYSSGNPVLKDVTATLPAGGITAIIGANGCGKSTLLKTIARFLPFEAGSITIDGVEVDGYKRRDLAKKLSFLPQSPTAPEGLSVEELVRFGRQPHHGMLSRHNREDTEAVDQALIDAGVETLRDRVVESLSGGQRQRAWIAMSLAQQADIMLFDEPTTYLDIQTQTEVLALLRKLNRDQGRTVVMVLHDLNQAARYASHVVAMGDGKVVASGAPRDIMTPELIRAVFHLECRVVDNPIDGTPLSLPLD